MKQVETHIKQHNPKLVAFDGNISSQVMTGLIDTCYEKQIPGTFSVIHFKRDDPDCNSLQCGLNRRRLRNPHRSFQPFKRSLNDIQMALVKKHQ